MFKLAEAYQGLDALFLTKEENHIRSNKSIQERLDELSNIYKDWSYFIFKFPLNEMERNYAQSRCRDTIELMREAATGYLLAFFDTTIIMSSIAVERLLQALLIINGKHYRKCKKNEKVENEIEIETNVPNPSLKEGGTITEYYGYRYDKAGHKGKRTVQFKKENGEWYYFEVPSLAESVGRLTTKEAPVCLLCDDSEKNGKPGDWIFVKRRNAMAHGAFENLNIHSQLWQLNQKSEVDLETFLNRKKDAFDQYRKASRFIMETFSRFKNEYGTWG